MTGVHGGVVLPVVSSPEQTLSGYANVSVGRRLCCALFLSQVRGRTGPLLAVVGQRFLSCVVDVPGILSGSRMSCPFSAVKERHQVSEGSRRHHCSLASHICGVGARGAGAFIEMPCSIKGFLMRTLRVRCVGISRMISDVFGSPPVSSGSRCVGSIPNNASDHFLTVCASLVSG